MIIRKHSRSKIMLLSVVLLALCAFSIFAMGGDAWAAETKTIKDMTGREITVAKNVKHVYGTGPSATIYLYTLAPDKLIGTNFEFNNAELKYIPSKYQKLPVLGNFSGSKGSANLEALIKAAPDVLVMTSNDLGKADKEDADKLQKQTGIPVFVIDGKLESTPQAYLALGKLMGVEEQAKKLFSYSYHAINGVKNRDIPERKRVSVFFGNGIKSLDTAPLGSSHAEVIALAAGKNVAALPGGAGRIEVGLEQVIKWNPQVLLINGEPKQALTSGQAVKIIMSSPNWSTVKAVKDQRVYSIPKAPYAWVDRPTGPNRIIGLKWVGKTLYPDHYQSLDLNKETKTFYRLFYHLYLTDSQVNSLLND